MAERPLGVMIICILGVIGALLSIWGAVQVLLIGSIFGGLFGGLFGGAAGGIISTIFSVIALLPMLIGIAILACVWWLWNMRKRGWTLVMILEVIALLFSLASLNIVGIVISGVIVAYLFMNKKLFK